MISQYSIRGARSQQAAMATVVPFSSRGKSVFPRAFHKKPTFSDPTLDGYANPLARLLHMCGSGKRAPTWFAEALRGGISLEDSDSPSATPRLLQRKTTASPGVQRARTHFGDLRDGKTQAINRGKIRSRTEVQEALKAAALVVPAGRLHNSAEGVGALHGDRRLP